MFEKMQFGLFNTSNVQTRGKKKSNELDYPSLIIQKTPEIGVKTNKKGEEVQGYLTQCGFELNKKALTLLGFKFEEENPDKLADSYYVDFGIQMDSKRLFIYQVEKGATNSTSNVSKTTYTFYKDATHDYLKDNLPWLNPVKDVHCELVVPTEVEYQKHPITGVPILEVVLHTEKVEENNETDSIEEADSVVSLQESENGFFN